MKPIGPWKNYKEISTNLQKTFKQILINTGKAES